jgi:hypothetical protein
MRRMSFLAKARSAAVTAKTQLDEVRDARAEMSVKPVAAAELTDHEERVLARARMLGAPDPLALLTAAEASEAAGTALGGPHLTYSDDMLGARYEANGSGGRHWRASASAFHAIDEHTPFDAREYWSSYLADMVSDDGVPVEGLGDAAIRRDGEVFVLAAPALLMVEVSTPEREGDGERAVALARSVLSRLR